jgi:trigger factor
VQVTVEKLGPCQAKIHFTVPSAEFQAAYRRGLQNISQNANMKGFRPGKVPVQIVEKQYGSQVKNDAIEHFVRQAYEQAVGENELKIVGFQRVNLDEVKILEGVDWAQSFEVSLRPEIELGDYKGIQIESALEPVMDNEITDAIENLRGQQSRPDPAGDAGVPADGMIVGKVQWLAGDEVVLERDGLRLSPKQPTPGTEAAAYESALVGAKDGETRDVEMTFPPEFDREHLRGQKGVTRVHVTQAYRMIPPTQEDIRKMFGVDNDQRLNEVVREKIGEAKQERENQRAEGAILEKLLATHTIELPEMMVDEQTRARLEQIKKQMKEQGTPDDRIAEQVESQRTAAREASEKGLRALFLVQTIGEKEKLLVTREDMEAELNQIAQRNRANLEEVRKYYQENRLFDSMAVEILERKVRRFLRENAKITTPS